MFTARPAHDAAPSVEWPSSCQNTDNILHIASAFISAFILNLSSHVWPMRVATSRLRHFVLKTGAAVRSSDLKAVAVVFVDAFRRFAGDGAIA